MSKKTTGTASATTTIVAVVVTLAVAGLGGFMVGQMTGKKSATIEAQAVATVNSEKITKLELYDRLVKDNGTKVLEDMIQEKLVDQAAKKEGVAVTPAETEAEITKIKTQIGGEDKFQEALAANNITLEQLKDYQAFRLKITKILGKDIKTDDETLKKFFTENTAQFDQREVHARHILVATEDEAKAIKADLDKGGDFAAIAKAKSTDTSNKDSGGDLGTFKPGNMVPEFDAAVFAMKKNEISAPVKTQYGYHIIQVLDTKGSAPVFENVKNDVKSAYIDSQVQEKAQAWLTDLKDKAKIENTLEPKKS